VTKTIDQTEGPPSLHLALCWAVDSPLPHPHSTRALVRQLQSDDEPALGSLFWAAFRGTIDDPGTAHSAAADAKDALTGRWGPMIPEASLAAWDGTDMVSAVVVLRDDAHKGLPLLAFVATHPSRQRQGLARALISAAVGALHAKGQRELHLAVTIGNPALTLYTALGFAVVDPE